MGQELAHACCEGWVRGAVTHPPYPPTNQAGGCTNAAKRACHTTSA